MQKLTKQQKRDLKRNQSNNANPQSSSNDKHHSKPSINAKTVIEGSSVYKRKPVYPTTIELKKIPSRFILPSEIGIFDSLMKTSYKGYQQLNPSDFHDIRNSANYSSRFQTSLESLENLGFYRFDVTQPTGLGTKLAKTFVKRCLVGDTGITYKYLGLRMFAYPWEADVTGSNPALIEIGRLNKVLADKTQQLLNKMSNNSSNSGDHTNNIGSCNYNLTLINRCFPVGGLKLKDEPMFEKDKMSVSWHADSSLEHYSSIAVYHFTKPTKLSVNKKTKIGEENEHASVSAHEVDESWKLALKVLNNAEGPNAQKIKPASSSTNTNSAKPNLSSSNSSESQPESSLVTIPPVAIPLRSEVTYFLLDEFNHHHQHALLAGKTDRYSSTHRVSRTDGHTYNSIKQKCSAALQGSSQSAKQIRTEQLSLSEVEFEWIRQYYVQGSAHHESQIWWHEPMQSLISMWVRLEQRTAISVQALVDAAVGLSQDSLANSHKDSKALSKRKKRASEVEEGSFDNLIEALNDRRSKRYGWQTRYVDEIWSKLTPECRPMAIPFPASAQWSVTTNTVPATSKGGEITFAYTVNYTKLVDLPVDLSQHSVQNHSPVAAVAAGGSDGYDPSAVEWIDQLDTTIELLESLKYSFIERKQNEQLQPPAQEQPAKKREDATAGNKTVSSKTKPVIEDEEESDDGDIGESELSDLLSNMSKVMKKHTSLNKRKSRSDRQDNNDDEHATGNISSNKIKKKKMNEAVKDTNRLTEPSSTGGSIKDKSMGKLKSKHDSTASVNRQKSVTQNVCSIQNLATALAARKK